PVTEPAATAPAADSTRERSARRRAACRARASDFCRGRTPRGLRRKALGCYLVTHGKCRPAPERVAPRRARPLSTGRDGGRAGLRLRDDEATACPRSVDRRRGLRLSAPRTTGARRPRRDTPRRE